MHVIPTVNNGSMYDTVRDNLAVMISLLDREEENSWSAFFMGALDAFDRGDYRECADIILSGGGGAGSLDDLVLGQGCLGDGVFAWKPDCLQSNERYRELLAGLRDFALEVRGSLHR